MAKLGCRMGERGREGESWAKAGSLKEVSRDPVPQPVDSEQMR
jgi:hypothetical protein